jgi:hypothetical protein
MLERSSARTSDTHSMNNVTQAGKIGWIMLWLIGIPIPVLFFLFLVRGCT